MIEKEYKTVDLKNGKKELIVLFKIKNSEILNSFFYSDVYTFEEWIKEAFDKVISGESIKEEVNGNVCCAKIDKEKTRIYDNLIEDDDEYYETYCEVDTIELRYLIDEWCNQVREFKKDVSIDK